MENEKMITFKIGGDSYEIEHDFLQEFLTESAVIKLEESVDGMGAMKGLIKSSISSFTGMLGIKKPKEFKDMDDLEYTVRYTLEGMMEQLEGKVIEIPARKVEADGSKD